MNYATQIIVAGLILFNFLFGQETGKLTVRSEPSGSWVRIDSVLVGKTPLDSLDLPVGRHQITVSPPEKGLWFAEDQIFEVKINSSVPETVFARFSRPVFLNTIPYGAAVFSQSKQLGTTPLWLPYSRFARKLLVFEKNGYRPDSLKLLSSNPVLIHLQKNPGFVEPQLPDFSDFSLGRKKSYKKYKIALLALSVAGSWAAFYFKNVADDNFEKYRRTADPVLIDKYWNQTRKYDRLSNASLGISYASLAGFIYFIIWK